MAFLDELNQTLLYILFALLAIVAIVALIYFFTRKRKKVLKEAYDSTDYAGFNRQDTKDYIKIDDIIDNVIITNNWTRFIGVIDCAGFDFYSMSAREQFSVMNNYEAFVNTIDAPITYRQYSCSADMEDTNIRYKQALKKVLTQIEEVFLRIDELCNLSSNGLSADELIVYDTQMKALSKQLDVLEFRRLHILDQLKYISDFSGNNVAPLLTQTYVFEWSSYSLEAADSMTKSQILAKAKTELSARASNMMHALHSSGVKARRCSTDELIDMFRRHSLPVSSERFKKRDVQNIQFDADIISSNSIEYYQEKISEQRNSELSKQGDALMQIIVSSIPNQADTEESDLSKIKAQETVDIPASDAITF